MAIDQRDRTTQPIPFDKPGRGRPKTSQNTRKEQLGIAQKALRKKRLKEGLKRVAVWMTPETQQAIADEVERTGLGRDEAVNQMINRAAGN